MRSPENPAPQPILMVFMALLRFHLARLIIDDIIDNQACAKWPEGCLGLCLPEFLQKDAHFSGHVSQES
ncbi:hypothetical protein [Bradyrhizobium zhanjiangense]|uniref:hypothetical protein n=1 Tax=Bradyrhizobium zhanjiangense TaxID=1325107 RepID=UPI0013E8F0AE|nr:hypothetical protein [Bradyrhizobium zhanjiangense]